jgi:CHAT domain-containing protein
MRTPEKASGGFTGLTDAFLAAGAQGVVGALWRVGDRPTAELMRLFHGAFSESGDAVTALATAQVALLRSTDKSLQSPAAWGAFRYAGR